MKDDNKIEQFGLLNEKIVKKIFNSDSIASIKFIIKLASEVFGIPVRILKNDYELTRLVNFSKFEKELICESDIVIILKYGLSEDCLYNIATFCLKNKYSDSGKYNSKICSINIENFDSNNGEFICFNNLLSEADSSFSKTEMSYAEINLEYLKKLGNKIINGSELEKNCYIFISNNDNILNKLHYKDYMSSIRKEINQLSKEINEETYYNQKQLAKAISDIIVSYKH